MLCIVSAEYYGGGKWLTSHQLPSQARGQLGCHVPVAGHRSLYQFRVFDDDGDFAVPVAVLRAVWQHVSAQASCRWR